MLGRRIRPLLDRRDVSFECGQRRVVSLLKILHEPRRPAHRDAENVVKHQYLAVDMRTSADTDDRHVERRRHGLAQFVGHAFEQHDIRARAPAPEIRRACARIAA